MDSSPCIIPPGEPLENSREAVITESREGILTRLSNAITKELYLIVEWAKLVPGFDQLCRKDQIALLTAGGMELIVFRLIYRSIPYKEHVYMNTTTLLVREDCYSVLNEEIVDMILDVVDRLSPLAMDDVEFACLKTILLADPGNDNQSFFLQNAVFCLLLLNKKQSNKINNNKANLRLQSYLINVVRSTMAFSIACSSPPPGGRLLPFIPCHRKYSQSQYRKAVVAYSMVIT